MNTQLKWAVLALAPFLAFSLACQHGLTLPPEGGGTSHREAELGKMPLKERRNLLPDTVSGRPPPEPGIYADQCDDLTHGGSNKGPDCVTDTIKCGQTIVGHTVGGVNRYNTRFYEANFCTPALTNHDGGDERVYRLVVPDGDRTALVTLDSPCADVDMAALRWSRDDCPAKNNTIHQCEMWPEPQGSREQVRLVSQKETTWLIVVEGKDEEEGAFSLSVQCWRGLM